jgi:membrane fusion protein (multidrug efflux system)
MMVERSRREVRLGVTLVSLLCALVACKREGEPTESAAASVVPVVKAVAVATVPAASRPMPRYITLTGTLVADRESNVAADISGKVLELPIDRGSTVRAGAVLAVLDRRSADIASREAAANVELARANSELARVNCKRADGLFQTGAIGQAEYERTKSTCDTSQSSLAAADARREAALKSLGDAVIRAPFAGVVSERSIDIGEYVQPQTQVVHLVATDPLRLRLNVPENLVGEIRPEMQVELQVAAYPDTWWQGKLRYVSASLREQTRDLLVEAVVANPEQKLRPGMFAVARLVMPKTAVTAVPEASLHMDGQLARLFVARQGVLEERIVELGTHETQWVEIRRGVASGEAVVSPFSIEAKDGAPVAK